MRYLCPRCGETYTVKPVNGVCRICDTPLVVEPEAQEAEHREGREGVPKKKL